MSAPKTSASPGSAGDAGTATSTLLTESYTGNTALGTTGNANIPHRNKDLPSAKPPVNAVPDVLAKALNYRQHGLDVHWLHPVESTDAGGNVRKGKEPVGRYKDRAPYSADELSASYQRGYGVGMLCGTGERHVYVIDFDCADTTQEARLRAELAKYIPTGATPTVVSGSGGEHYWIELPDEMQPAGRVLYQGTGKHNEVRFIGHRANVVLPPTLHETGERYRTLTRKVYPATPALLEALRETSTANMLSAAQDSDPFDLNDLPDYILERIALGDEDGQRSERIHAVIAHMREAGFTRANMRWLMLESGEPIGDKPGEKGDEWALGEIDRITGKVDLKQAADLAALVAKGWDEPANLFIRPTLPRIEREMLPKIVGDFAFAQAKAIGCDPALIAMPALVAIAATIGAGHSIQLSASWHERSILWTAAVADSGMSKTPAINAALAPAMNYNVRLIREYQRRLDAVGGDYKALEGVRRSLITNNLTPEGLADLLEYHKWGVLAHSDELAELIGRLDAFNGGGGKDRAAMLTARGGGSIAINRARKHTWVENFAVSIVGGIQPARLATLLGKHGLSDDGFLQRFLVFFPEDGELSPLSMQSSPAVDAYGLLFKRLEGLSNEFLYQPTDAARQVFDDYRHKLKLLQQNTSNQNFGSHLSKVPGFVAQLAMTMHVAEQTGRPIPTIEASTVQTAIALVGGYLLRHAKAFYEHEMPGKDEMAEAVGAIVELILAKRLEKFTMRDLTQGGGHSLRRLLSDERLCTGAVAYLEDHNWIRDASNVRAQGQRGRRPKIDCIVNPLVHERFAAEAEARQAKRTALKEAWEAASPPRNSD